VQQHGIIHLRIGWFGNSSRHFQADIILICTRWYLRDALSYRDLEEMMTERGLSVDHTTIYRWVQECAPELAKRSHPYLKQTNDS
jgi:IS6 family transposase